MKRAASVLATLMVVMLVVFTSAFSVQAQGGGLVCHDGMCEEGGDGSTGEPVQVGGLAVPEEEAGVQAEGMGRNVVYSLHGGYTAAGVALRNKGAGTIALTGIPVGATVYRAFLYWNIVDYTQQTRHKYLYFKGVYIGGSFIGADHQPCWISDWGASYSYRADVTSLVKANGNYTISGVASGRTTGVDPWNSSYTTLTPLAEGASLVVIYAKSSLPTTQIYIWDGAAAGGTVTPYIAVGPMSSISNPVGPAKTTAIVADGQNSAAGPNLTVNGQVVAGSDFAGTDTKYGGGSYTYGNLWDTRTYNVGKYLNPYPGITSVQVGLNTSSDCVTWVAQVFSISSGALDSDGDALLDGWEANGHNSVDLPGLGANPFHKDIFVWMDYMPEHVPSAWVVDTIRASFATAPVSNPDGKIGINLHSFYGYSVAEKENMGATCSSTDIWNGFDAYKNAYFPENFRDTFHYMIWAHNQCPGNSSSGLARGIPASDFMVTMGLWGGFGTDPQRAGTYMHELGHDLGLTHGGNYPNDHVNYKPNHLSIMNYSFQVIGVWRSGARRWDYQRTTVNALNELALNETLGLRSGTTVLTSYGTHYHCASGWKDDSTAATIDWNCSGALSTSVAVDLNYDGVKNTLGATQNQWTHLIYDGGSIGTGVKTADGLSAEAFFDNDPCLTYEDFTQ